MDKQEARQQNIILMSLFFFKNVTLGVLVIELKMTNCEILFYLNPTQCVLNKVTLQKQRALFHLPLQLSTRRNVRSNWNIVFTWFTRKMRFPDWLWSAETDFFQAVYVWRSWSYSSRFLHAWFFFPHKSNKDLLQSATSVRQWRPGGQFGQETWATARTAAYSLHMN